VNKLTIAKYKMDDSQQICMICHECEPKEFLINICKCTCPMHATCIREVYLANNRPDCTVCKEKFDIQETYNRYDKNNEKIIDIYFPKYNIYYQSEMSSSPYKIYKGFDALAMAVMYHQKARVVELLQVPEIKQNNINSYVLNAKKKNNLLHILCMNYRNNDVFDSDAWFVHGSIFKILTMQGVSAKVPNAIGMTAIKYSEYYSPLTMVYKLFIADLFETIYKDDHHICDASDT
jgi:hypothetical protein